MSYICILELFSMYWVTEKFLETLIEGKGQGPLHVIFEKTQHSLNSPIIDILTLTSLCVTSRFDNSHYVLFRHLTFDQSSRVTWLPLRPASPRRSGFHVTNLTSKYTCNIFIFSMEHETFTSVIHRAYQVTVTAQAILLDEPVLWKKPNQTKPAQIETATDHKVVNQLCVFTSTWVWWLKTFYFPDIFTLAKLWGSKYSLTSLHIVHTN